MFFFFFLYSKEYRFVLFPLLLFFVSECCKLLLLRFYTPFSLFSDRKSVV